MSLSVTWMDEIIGDRSHEWMQGYLMGQNTTVALYFGRGGWDKTYNRDHGWVYVCEADIEIDNQTHSHAIIA